MPASPRRAHMQQAGIGMLSSQMKRADVCMKGLKALADACRESGEYRDEIRLRGGIEQARARGSGARSPGERRQKY